MLYDIFKLFSRWTLGKVKIALFSLLVTSCSFQFGLDLKLKEKEFHVYMGDIPPYLTITICSFFLILIFVDFWYYFQKNKDKKKLFSIIENARISDEVKIAMINKYNDLQ